MVEREIEGILVLNPLPTADSLGRPEREESTGQAGMVTNRKGGSNFRSHEKQKERFASVGLDSIKGPPTTPDGVPVPL